MRGDRSFRCGLAAATVLFLIVGLVGLSIVSAQSLGEVARREAERRKTVTSGRVYTDDDLMPVDPSQSVPAPAPVVPVATAEDKTPMAGAEAEPTAGAAGSEADVKPPFKPREKRDEQYWRARAQDLRGRLARVTSDLAAIESRLREIDAGPQTPAMAREREVVAKALARLQASARNWRDEVSRFEARAQAANIPADWSR